MAQTEQQTNRANSVISAGGNFVDKINELIRVRGMYARVVNSELLIGVGLGQNLNPVVEYRFVHNGDGLLLLRGVKSGVEDLNANLIDVTLNGSFNQNNPPHAYTSTVGGSFDFEFTGSSLFFRRTVEDRGGLWEFHLDNGYTRKISCWKNIVGTSTNEEVLVFDNLPHGTYKGKAIFKGEDPIHPPSNGTARGYLWLSDSLKPLRHGKVRPINNETAKYIVSQNSIPDFAISGKKSGASYGQAWVPHHGTVTGVSSDIYLKIIIDGLPIHEGIGTFPSLTYREIEDFEIIQKFVAKNPNENIGLWDHYITHSIRKRNPYLTIKNNVKPLINVDVGVMYFAMLPAPQSNMSRLLLNNRKEYRPIPTDGSEDTFGLDVTSAVYTGMFEPGNFHACAIDVSSLREAISYGKDIESNPPGRITFRTNNVSKVYFTVTNNATLQQGETYSCMHRIACITGVRFPHENLESL